MKRLQQTQCGNCNRLTTRSALATLFARVAALVVLFIALLVSPFSTAELLTGSSIDFIVGGAQGNTSLMKGLLVRGPNQQCFSTSGTQLLQPAPFVYRDNNPNKLHHYRAFELWNNGPEGCVEASLEWKVADCGSLPIGVSLYLGSFNPNDLTENLLSHSYVHGHGADGVGADDKNEYAQSPGSFPSGFLYTEKTLDYNVLASAKVPALQKVIMVLDSQARSPENDSSGLSCPVNTNTASLNVHTKNLSSTPLEVSVNDSSVNEYQTGDTPMMQFYISLSAQLNQPFSVQYATASAGLGPAFAVAGTDYTATSGTLTFNPGETAKIVQVPVIGNNAVQPNRSFQFNLSNPSSTSIALSDANAIGTIFDDDTTDVCRITNVIGLGDLPIGVVGQTYAPVSMIASTQPLVDPDYQWEIVDSSLLPPGITLSQTSPGPPADNNKGVLSGTPTLAGTYNFTVKLTCPEVAGDGAVVPVVVNKPMTIIIENDLPPVFISLTDVAILEGDVGTKQVLVPVVLSAPLAKDTIFEVLLYDGSAKAGDNDYAQLLSIPQLFQINAGEASPNPIPINIIGDKNVEENEVLFVELRTVISKTVIATATITIVNDDAPPALPAKPVPLLHWATLMLMALLTALFALVALRTKR